MKFPVFVPLPVVFVYVFLRVGNEHGAELSCAAGRKQQQLIVHTAKLIRRSRWSICTLPNDLIPKIPPPEDRVHDGLEVVGGRGIAVQVDGARRLEHAAHGEQADGHEAHERAHAVGVRISGALDGLHEAGVIVGDLVHPVLVHVALPGPSVLKLRPGGEAIGRGVEVAAFVERRVRGCEVHGL